MDVIHHKRAADENVLWENIKAAHVNVGGHAEKMECTFSKGGRWWCWKQ